MISALHVQSAPWMLITGTKKKVALPHTPVQPREGTFAELECGVPNDLVTLVILRFSFVQLTREGSFVQLCSALFSEAELELNISCPTPKGHGLAELELNISCPTPKGHGLAELELNITSPVRSKGSQGLVPLTASIETL